MTSAPGVTPLRAGETERYLARLGLDRWRPTVDLDALTVLQRAHLEAVPFENLDVYRGTPVGTGLDWSVPKLLDRGRGGWCFELNGAFGALLAALGFPVRYLGAAVQLSGPSERIDHLLLEVHLDRPYLVDVGFGDGPCLPLALDRRGRPQDGLVASFELFPGARGTTLARYRDGGAEAQYRFKRVDLSLADLDGASRHLQADRTLPWHRRAFATRVLDGGPDRVTLIGRQLKIARGTGTTSTPVDDDDWSEVLETWFGFRVMLAGPPERPAANGPGA